MSKVGRASRNSSLMRTESITGTKTITAVESGEVYFINYNTGATIEILLPPVKAGAYCKFVWATVQAHNDAIIEFKPPDGAAAGVLKGVIQCMETDGTGPSAEADSGSATKFSVDGNPNVSLGSYLEAICDGTSWFLSGIIMTVEGGTAGNVIAWDA